MALHILKLCVGIDSLQQLRDYHRQRLLDLKKRKAALEFYHNTRQIPRRADEIVGQGSLYWIIKGFIRCRQPILRLDLLDPPVEMKRCRFVLQPKMIETELQARRPHQGWRYLKAEDAPADLPAAAAGQSELPEAMASELRNLGLL